MSAPADSRVSDDVVAKLVEEVAQILSGASFPSAISYAKARQVTDLFLAAISTMGDVVAVSELEDVIRKESTYAGHMKRETRAIAVSDLSAILNRGGK